MREVQMIAGFTKKIKLDIDFRITVEKSFPNEATHFSLPATAVYLFQICFKDRQHTDL